MKAKLLALFDLGPGDIATIDGQLIQVSWISAGGSFVRRISFDDDGSKRSMSEPFFMPGDRVAENVKRNKEFYAGRGRPGGGEVDPLA